MKIYSSDREARGRMGGVKACDSLTLSWEGERCVKIRNRRLGQAKRTQWFNLDCSQDTHEQPFFRDLS